MTRQTSQSTVIDAIQTAVVSASFRDALVVHGSRGAHAHSEFVLVRIVTSDGHEGFGEVSATPMWSGEDAASAVHFIRGVISEVLIGQPLHAMRALSLLIDRQLYGNAFTKAGVNTALWDAYSRTLGIPLSDALGGTFRTEVPIKISVSGDHGQLDACVEEALSLGFGDFKVKVGRGVDSDVERVRQVRRAVGEQPKIGVDANTGWTRSEAARAIEILRKERISFVEQPLAEDDLLGMGQLRSFGIPLVADESVRGEADVVKVASSGAADLVSLYVGMAGGPAHVVDAAKVANSLGIDVVIGSNGDMSIGAAAQIHAACAIPRLGRIPHDICGPLLYQSDIAYLPPVIDGRVAKLPPGPGLGVRPSDEIMARFE